jgi:hypothetical protein
MKDRVLGKSLTLAALLAASIPIGGKSIAASTFNSPIMGWSTYSQQTIYGENWITEGEIKVQADQIHQTLQSSGFTYVNIDSGWSNGQDSYGRPVVNTSLFPDGMANVAAYVHNYGLKLGIYCVPGIGSDEYNANPPIYGTSYHIQDIVKTPRQPGNAWGSTTTANNYEIDYTKPGAQEYINSIVNELASWGIDYIKLDGVSPGSDVSFPTYDQRGDVQAYQNAIQQCGRPMFLTVSWHINSSYASFFKQYSDACRIDDDIEAYNSGGLPLTGWNQISWRFSDAVNWCNSSGYGGGWEDLDSLDCGEGSVDGTSNDERQTMATFWALQCANWYTGDDPYHFDSFGTWLLTNPALIYIDQAGHVAKQIQGGNSQIWATQNQDGTHYIGLFNLSGSTATVTVNWSSLNLSGSQDVFDVLGNADLGQFTNSYSVTLNSHASKLIQVGCGGVTWYKICNVGNGTYLTVSNGSTVDGGQLVTASDTGSPTQRWQLVSAGSGAYYLVNENSGKQVNIPGGSTSAGTQLIQYHNDSSSNSKWKEVAAGSGYNFVSVSDSQLLDLAGGSVVDQWPSNGGTNQQWQVIPCVLNDTSTGVTYTGSWNYSANRGLGDYGDDVHWTSNNGDSCTATFTGTGITFVTEKNSDEGNVDVYVDGQHKATVNCANSTRQTQQSVYSISGLSRGNHTIQVVKSSSSYMLVDEFLIAP